MYQRLHPVQQHIWAWYEQRLQNQRHRALPPYIVNPARTANFLRFRDIFIRRALREYSKGVGQPLDDTLKRLIRSIAGTLCRRLLAISLAVYVFDSRCNLLVWSITNIGHTEKCDGQIMSMFERWFLHVTGPSASPCHHHQCICQAIVTVGSGQMAEIVDTDISDDRGVLIDYFRVIQCFFVSHSYHQETNAVIVQ